MKTSSVLASLLFGSFAVAAPLQARGRPVVTHTRVVTETVVVYTTVYDDVPEATATSEGLFYEQPKVTSSSVVASSSAAVSSAQAPSSVYTPPAPATSAAASTPVVEQPKQETQPTSAAAAPVVASSAAAPAPAATSAAAVQPQAQTKPAASSDTTTTGQTYSGDITVYEPAGGYGACGTQLQNTDMVVALSHVAFGASTYDTMTGAATNPWCGQKINIQYNGNSVQATIMDMCPGCSGDDIDLSDAVWKAVTGSDEKTRYKATWSKAS